MADVRQEIDRLNARIAGAYAAGDVDALVKHFADDCWQMPPHSEPSRGRDGVRAYWQEAFDWGSWQFELDTQDVVVRDDIAVERGSYRVRFDAGISAPMPSFDDAGNYVVMWRREQDGWRIVWDAPVSTVPLPQGAQ